MILVTGATGYIGRRVVKGLVQDGKTVRCLVRPSSSLSPVEGLKVQVFRGDVTEADTLKGACEGVEEIVHTVAVIRERGRYTYDLVNHIGTKNLVEAAEATKVKRLVHLSAIGTGPDPKYSYLYSKWQGERAVVGGRVPYVILRASIVFGLGDEFINALAAAVKLGPVTPIIGSGKTRFQPLFVDDFAHCSVLALKDDSLLGKTIELGGPEELTYTQIIDAVIEAFGYRRLKVRVPVMFVGLLARLMGLAAPHPTITPQELSMINLDSVTEAGSVAKYFGFQPKPLKENIDFIRDIKWKEAVAIALGFRSARRW